MEKYAPDFTGNFSTAKSPQQMLSALAKSYWAEKAGVDPKSIYMVSIMPCTAKKYEIGRDETMSSTGTQDTDKVLTTRELARMIQSAGIEFNDLPEEAADELLGEYTGAGTIFGVTGGVMEAALRTAYCLITGEAQPPSIEFTAVRGMQGGPRKAIATRRGVAAFWGVKEQSSVRRRGGRGERGRRGGVCIRRSRRGPARRLR